jgi:hypothetical protein
MNILFMYFSLNFIFFLEIHKIEQQTSKNKYENIFCLSNSKKQLSNSSPFFYSGEIFFSSY